MQVFTEAQFYALIEQAKSPKNIDARLAVLNMHEQYARKLTEFSLRAVYRMLYDDFNKIINSNPVLMQAAQANLDSFKTAPCLKNLQILSTGITEFCRVKSFQAYFSVQEMIAKIFRHVASSLDIILDEKFPGLRQSKTVEAMEILDAARTAGNKSDFVSIGEFIKCLSSRGSQVVFNKMMSDYGASCINAGNSEYIRSYLDEQGLHYEDFSVHRFRNDAVANGLQECTSITLVQNPHSAVETPELTLPTIKLWNAIHTPAIQCPIQCDFLVDHEDVDSHAVLIINNDSATDCVRFACGVAASITVAFGRENMEYVVVDAANSGLMWELQSMIQPSRLTVCQSGEDVSRTLENLDYFIENRVARIGNYIRKIRKSKEITENALVAIFINPHTYTGTDAELYHKIVRKAYRAGVIVISIMPESEVSRTQMKGLILDTTEILPMHDVFNSVAVSEVSSIEDNWFEKWLPKAPRLKDKWSFGMGKKSEVDVGELSEDEIEKDFVVLTDSKMNTTIGQSEDNEFEFNFDTISHTHAFIMGKTGSGKSVLLHNIIVGLIRKYSPEDVQLYLLDFKLGGVEFNRYRNVKHLRSLLVDNSDYQIVLEIMRDIDRQMKDRGKALRDAGVNNITDYNNGRQDGRMSQIIVVIDECHQIFNSGSIGNSKLQNEVTGILTKIAKEGRSQGVHLIFATQTLAGADIPSDILNNITDYYLMNCAPADSERLVSGSSRFTYGLKVGQVYYHHVEQHNTFQGSYIPQEESYRTVDKIIEKSSSYKSNGQSYFNGSQEYDLSEELSGLTIENSKINVICGKTIDMQRNNLKISLQDDYCENILVCGLNKDDNTSRTAVVPMLSALAMVQQNGEPYRFIVLNSSRGDGESIKILEKLQDAGLIQYINGDKLNVLKQLADEILNENVIRPTILCILGQEYMRELKLNLVFQQHTSTNPVDDLMSGMDFGVSDYKNGSVTSVAEAVDLILDKGPAVGIHTIMQIDKLDRFLFMDYPSRKDVFKKFKHIILLRSDDRTSQILSLADDCHPERLTDEETRLRGIYYNDDADSYTLFTPFRVPAYDNFIDVINK